MCDAIEILVSESNGSFAISVETRASELPGSVNRVSGGVHDQSFARFNGCALKSHDEQINFSMMMHLHLHNSKLPLCSPKNRTPVDRHASRVIAWLQAMKLPNCNCCGDFSKQVYLDGPEQSL